MIKGIRQGKQYNTLIVFGLVFAYLLFYGFTDLQAQTKQDPKAMAEQACQDVGQVKESFRGTKGAPILILEENHASRAGQIEQAITMVRLHDKEHLRDIALEGYKIGDPEINRDWFVMATKGLSFNARATVAVRLLKEGDISCAEFMKLVYDDIAIHRTEKKEEYAVDLGQDAAIAPFLYLLKIAEKSLRQEHVPTINKLTKEFKALEKQKNKESLEKKRKELVDYVLSADPWVNSRHKMLQDKKDYTSEQQLALAREIANKVASLSIKLDPEEKKAMARYIAFFEGRSKASGTMIAATEKIADRSNLSLVALVSGAAHTGEMGKTLKNKSRPFAVIRPLSYESDISWERFQNKYKKGSLYSKGLIAGTIIEAFPRSSQKKPESVFQEPWFKIKAELYASIVRIAKGILGPPTLPGGGKPPYGFGPNDFRGEWSFIDPHKISLVQDAEGPRVIFPVIFNPDKPSSRTLWVKAGLVPALVAQDEQESVEVKLRRALTEVKQEGKLSDQLEDLSGILQIGPSIKAGIASKEEEIRKKII